MRPQQWRKWLGLAVSGAALGCSGAAETGTVAVEPTLKAAPAVPTLVTPMAAATPAPSDASRSAASAPSVWAATSPLFARATAPGPLPPLPLPSTEAPRNRSTDLHRGELPLPRITLVPVSIPAPAVKPLRPAPPVEKVPVNLGVAAAEDLTQIKAPETPRLKAPSVVNPGAADVPPLTRQLVERASLEDPTAEITRVRTVETSLPLPVGNTPPLRLVIPDPFEFQEQLKPKWPERPEFGAAPQTVPPARP